MDNNGFEIFKKKVYVKLSEEDKSILPDTWWESVIKHYYNMGYTVERTVRSILETVRK